MNDSQQRRSRWGHRLLLGWLSLGWVVAIVLALVSVAPLWVVHAEQTGKAKSTSPVESIKGAYSPIGLTFDNGPVSNVSGVNHGYQDPPVTLVLMAPATSTAEGPVSWPTALTEAYAVHNVSSVSWTDSGGANHSCLNNTQYTELHVLIPHR